jgi:hypothetical protein
MLTLAGRGRERLSGNCLPCSTLLPTSKKAYGWRSASLLFRSGVSI